VLLGFAVCEAAVCYGLFTLQKWAYRWALIVFGVELALGAIAWLIVLLVIALSKDYDAAISIGFGVGGVPSLAVKLLEIVYLRRPRVRAYFRRALT